MFFQLYYSIENIKCTILHGNSPQLNWCSNLFFLTGRTSTVISNCRWANWALFLFHNHYLFSRDIIKLKTRNKEDQQYSSGSAALTTVAGIKSWPHHFLSGVNTQVTYLYLISLIWKIVVIKVWKWKLNEIIHIKTLEDCRTCKGSINVSYCYYCCYYYFSKHWC